MSTTGAVWRNRYVIVAVLAAVAVLAGRVGPWAYAAFSDTSAKDRIEADPPPRLFPDATVAAMGREIEQQQRTADDLMSQWWTTHDAVPSDSKFEAWLRRTLPGPPTAADRRAEIRRVQALAPTRTRAGVVAASWLETHGKKDLWKLAMHDQAEMLGPRVGDRRKQELDELLKMSKDVADALGARYRQPAPYVVDPSLRPDHTVTPGQVCPCSYPSRHATAGAASRTYLSFFSPHRSSDYRWTEDEIDYSRIYMAGHVNSDIRAGALLGDMIGEYFLVTRHHRTGLNDVAVVRR